MTFSIFYDIYYKNINIMGRKSKPIQEKKGKISVFISITNYNILVDKNVNKSKLINWLLEQHFNSLNNEK
jgi:hypothetical protein